MAGVISFSNGDSWHISGWGWRRLLERAREFTGESQADLLEGSLYTQGLSFALLELSNRSRVAAILQQAASQLASEPVPESDEYGAQYIERLRELVRLLENEKK